MLKRLFVIGYAMLWLVFFLAPVAEAYLDPGTGSYVCQMLLAGVVGAAFVVKLYWNRLKALVSGFFSRDLGG
jgi:hypothetical protein